MSSFDVFAIVGSVFCLGNADVQRAANIAATISKMIAAADGTFGTHALIRLRAGSHERLIQMLKTHAVGIDLGTTYSCISYLNEHGEPVTLANQEGELSTPSVVLFDEGGEVVVGTEALRNAVVKPLRVVQNSKRYMGDLERKWVVDDRAYTPIDIATLVLKKLLSAAEEQIGRIEQAVITVPAQFSDIQRQWVMEAGKRAGLSRVDMINEPVAAALCYVLGTEGLWFTELAEEQRIMVYDLGGGTFDLSLVKYQKNEVKVIASSGDLNLGGIDWNSTLLDAIAGQFSKEFKVDPRSDPESLQFLALEVENTKRSLTVRPKAALTCQHAGHRKSYQIEQGQFESLTRPMVKRTCELTQAMLKDNKMGWAHVDVILTVGGSSRMPMIRNALKQLGGRTLNTSLSPDQSIAHGATYYAGMLLTNNDFAKSILNEDVSARLASIKQQSVNARGLGILVRDRNDNKVPHYQIPANTPLPASITHQFGTVSPNQTRVHLRIVESGTKADDQYVELGTCIIEDLPPDLPENSQIQVTISYDEQARVHVSATDVASGKKATTEIVRAESVVVKDGVVTSSAAIPAAAPEVTDWQSTAIKTPTTPRKEKSSPPPVPRKAPSTSRPVTPRPVSGEIVIEESRTGSVSRAAGSGKSLLDDELEDAGMPVPLCNKCGETLDHRGGCPACSKSKASGNATPGTGKRQVKVRPTAGVPASSGKTPRTAAGEPPRKRAGSGPKSSPAIPLDDDEILELEFSDKPRPKKSPTPDTRQKVQPKKVRTGGPSVKAPPLPPSLSGKSDKSANSGTLKKGG
ncbi:MAG: Hsp70 family protein, partial [Planctomycetota bacterium]|nr:Hsp70 family protein [Planctomycetota bacterium]